ncbi:sigma-70 family RNA polymerase sigma factor [Clostridium sp. MCC353]|uniref:sigma-70 family RNA polymerase sigma factor n=1 Tax=Clostridium sp. MCC353 TaxID=2592646 RepID=UPI001C01BBBA|nr:sigma-70 family RNA polymerase sigma factor [Clostridium sp. MCC353]MBT9777523.1 sigma-70 family RNA polymerase sigma factor [Clostridium sp. MCC353]
MNKTELEVERLLLDNYQKYYRLAYSYLKNENDALDAVQESAYRAIKDCRKMRQPEYLETWIYRIVMNVSIDLLRKKKRENLVDEIEESAYEPPDSGLEVAELLNVLEEKDRTVIILRFFEDMKLEDIAKVMEENINTVKSRLYRALKKLRVNLEPGAL